MKSTQSKLTIVVSLMLVLGFAQNTRASITLNYDLSIFTYDINNTLSGTLLLISHGSSNVFESGSGWAAGSTTFLRGNDTLLAAVAITAGTASGALNNIVAPAGSIYGTTQFTGLFINGLTSSNIDYSTGSLLGGLQFASSGGTSYWYGSYRSNNVESYGNGPVGKVDWTIPADGSTNDFWAASAVQGGDYVADLNAGSQLSLVPEPSSAALLALGSVALFASRTSRKRKV
jgi:hypothetical protein